MTSEPPPPSSARAARGFPATTAKSPHLGGGTGVPPRPALVPAPGTWTTHGEREDAAVRAARIKSERRIEEVVMGHGVALSAVGGGRRLVGLCPFHAEKHASFTVYPETQSFCCYGCHVAGDVITFICLFKRVRFDEALRILGEARDAVTAPGRAGPIRRGSGWSSVRPARRAGPEGPTGWAPARRSVIAFPASDAPPGAADAAERPSASPLHAAPMDAPVQEREGPSDGEEGRWNGMPADTAVAALTLLCATTALAMQGLARAPLALTYLGGRGISYALARRCRLGYLEDDALAGYLAGDRQLERIAQRLGLLNRLGRGTLTRRLIVPEVRQGQTTQLIGRVLPGAGTPLPHIKYYLVCGARERGLLGYGAGIERLAQRSQGEVRGRGGREPLGILVIEGVLDYVIAVGWELPVLPVALLSSYPGRAQLRELLDLQTRSGDLPFLLLLDADGPGREGAAYVMRAMRERHAPVRVLPPLQRPLAETATYKDLGELGPLGNTGRAQLLAAIARAAAREGHEGEDEDG